MPYEKNSRKKFGCLTCRFSRGGSGSRRRRPLQAGVRHPLHMVGLPVSFDATGHEDHCPDFFLESHPSESCRCKCVELFVNSHAQGHLPKDGGVSWRAVAHRKKAIGFKQVPNLTIEARHMALMPSLMHRLHGEYRGVRRREFLIPIRSLE